jgi:hypothetical protein
MVDPDGAPYAGWRASVLEGALIYEESDAVRSH